MGYTHYWTQTRSFTKEEWIEVSADLAEILSYVENDLGVPLANGMGDGGTRPEFTGSIIQFNGVGDDSHETFTVDLKRTRLYPGATLGGSFCKTARKPYDIAVTACLCYLSSVAGAFSVSSDGSGSDFVLGLDAARKALPNKANQLDIPMDVMKRDRWTGPWVSGQTGSGFEVHFCIDGKGYVIRSKTGESYCFKTHRDLGVFLNQHKTAQFRSGGSTGWGGYGRTEPNIWDARGSFDPARHQRIARAQAKVLRQLFPVPPEHDQQPPAYVRPDTMLRPEEKGEFCYSLRELLEKASAPAAA